MFNVGDLVVHPMHGAGVIDAIVREKIAGCVQEYYVFKMPLGDLVLKIPVSNSQTIGIRTVMPKEDAQALLDAIPNIEIESNANWNKRYHENLLRLKSGDLYEVARVVKSLAHRESRRGLSTGERKMLLNAKQIMVSELALAVNTDYKSLEAALEKAVAQNPARRKNNANDANDANDLKSVRQLPPSALR